MKGTFKGKFTGLYSKGKSKKNSDAILEIEITEGEIDVNTILLNQSITISTGIKSFPIKSTANINVKLYDENEFENQFTIDLKKIDLFNYQFIDCIHLEKNIIQGTLIGNINSYTLNDTKDKNEITSTTNTHISKNESLLESSFTEKHTFKEFSFKKSIILWLLVIGISLGIYFFIIYLDKNKQTDIFAEKDENFKKEQLLKKSQYQDSLARYLNLIKAFKHEQNYKEALEKINQATLFASSSDKKKLIQEANNIQALQAEAFIKKRKYKDAITIYSNLISTNNFNLSYQYKRALCYSKLGKIKDAVKDLKSAIESNDQTAQKLYNKINPLKKRVAYYITRCCDGTTSNATGKGACSHHDGVCDWKEPVYEEYREYE